MHAFREAYVQLVNASRTGSRNGSFLPSLVPGNGVNAQEWNRLRSKVAATCGAAGPSYNRHGGTFTLRNAAYISNNVNPVDNWDLSFRDPEQFPPETVLSAVEAAIASAAQKASDARDRERGVTGIIAAFLRWPSTLREAVDPESSGQQWAAGVIGVAGQIVVGIVASVLATGLVAVGVLAFRAAF